MNDNTPKRVYIPSNVYRKLCLEMMRRSVVLKPSMYEVLNDMVDDIVQMERTGHVRRTPTGRVVPTAREE